MELKANYKFTNIRIPRILNSQYLQYFAVFALKSLSFCGFLQYSFGFHSRYCEIHGFQLNPWYPYICKLIIFNISVLWTKCNAGCVFLHFRRQWWPVFVWFVLFITSLWCVSFVLSNQYVLCIGFIVIFVCSSIYQWNPYKSSDFFNIFSDLTSVYCEIREILIICILVSPQIFVYKSVSAGFRREEGSVFCICFLKQLVTVCLFIHYIVHFNLNLVWVSDLHYKSSIYLYKSSDFLNIFEDFILEYC